MNRTILRTTTAVAAVSAAALFFPATASAAPVSSTNCAATSSPGATNGWGNPFSDEAGQAGTYSDVVVGDSDGSLEFTTVDTLATTKVDNRAASYHTAGDLLLGDLAGPLTFQQKGAAAFWQIRVTGAATVGAPASENGFATLVWGGDTATDAFGAGGWWATRDLPGYARGVPTTLEKLSIAAGSNTKITEYGVSVEGPVGTKGQIDKVSFNGCTTNFVAQSAPGGGSTGSLGDFGLANLIPGLPS